MKSYQIRPGCLTLPDDLPPQTLRDMSKGRYERHKTALISRLQAGDIFIDVGAHVGYHSLWALKAGAKVIAFEPHILSFQTFLQNMDDNGYQNTVHYRLSNRPVWSTVAERPYFWRKSSVHHGLMNKAIAGQPIVETTGLLETTTLDREVSGSVAMVKIDVQGAELHVIEGMRQTLKRNPALVLLVEVHKEYGVLESDVLQRLADYPNVKVVF